MTFSTRENIVYYVASTWVITLLVLPFWGLYWGWQESEGDSFFTILNESLNRPRTTELMVATLLRAICAACLSVFLGLFVAFLSQAVSPPVRNWSRVFVLGVFLLSPYIIVQSYIGYLGSNGLLWQWLGSRPEWFNLYSSTGVVVMQAIVYLPIAYALISLRLERFPASLNDEVAQYGIRGGKHFSLYLWPKYGLPVVGSMILILILAFWNYEIPSMLRQNSYPIEVLAAFGSFYDYRIAWVLTTIAALPLLVTGLGMLIFIKRLSMPVAVKQNAFVVDSKLRARVFRAVVMLYFSVSVVVPLFGLVWQIGSIEVMWKTTKAFQSDIFNSARNGMIVCLAATLIAGGVMLWSRLKENDNWLKGWTIVGLLMLCLPGVIVGMGYSYFFTHAPIAIIESTKSQLMFVQLQITLPLMLIYFGVMFRLWPSHWTMEMRSFGLSTFKGVISIAVPYFLPVILMGLSLAFVWAIREVPASLINTPPKGSTLALSIETLLHFEQPEKVASLCLLQFAMTALIGVVSLSLAKPSSSKSNFSHHF